MMLLVKILAGVIPLLPHAEAYRSTATPKKHVDLKVPILPEQLQQHPVSLPFLDDDVTAAAVESQQRQQWEAMMMEQAERTARSSHDVAAFNALFVPVPERPDPAECIPKVNKANNEGHATTGSDLGRWQLPPDFPPGCFLRIGPHGGLDPKRCREEGFFDGDGMVTCVTFPPHHIGAESVGVGKGSGHKTKASSTKPTGQAPEATKGEVYTRDHRTMTQSTTFVQTAGRRLETAAAMHGAGQKFRGLLGGAPRGLPVLQSLLHNAVAFQTLMAQKDTCNTALALHGNRLLALMEQSPPTEIRATRDGRVHTVEPMTRLDGAVPKTDMVTGGSLGAHGRTDPETGERVHVSYSSASRPYVRVDTFEPSSSATSNDSENDDDAASNGSSKNEKQSEVGRSHGWKLKSTVPVDIPAPVMMHDCALTPTFVVLFDFPLTVRPSRFLEDAFPVEFEPSNGARIGLLLRRESVGGEREITWFPVKPGVVLHAVNAFETTDDDEEYGGEGKVVVHAFRSEPKVGGEDSYILKYGPTHLHEWVLDLRTNEVLVDRCLNPSVMVEFPAIDDRKVGRKVQDAFAMRVKTIGGPLTVFKTPEEGVLSNSIVRFSLTGQDAGDVVDEYSLPDKWYVVSEPTLVPKVVGPTEATRRQSSKHNRDNDDEENNTGVYVMIIATKVPDQEPNESGADPLSPWDLAQERTSRMFVLDGNEMSKGPVSVIDLPQTVPYGLHSMYLNWEDME